MNKFDMRVRGKITKEIFDRMVELRQQKVYRYNKFVSYKEIADVISLEFDISIKKNTVQYWLDPKIREARRKYSRERSKRLQHWRDPEKREERKKQIRDWYQRNRQRRTDYM